MTAKMTYSDVRTLQDSIPVAGMQGHYVMGAYSVMIADLVSQLPKHKQAEYKDALERLALRASEINP